MPENELIILILGTVILWFIFLYRAYLLRLPAVNWLLASFFALWVAWVSTVVEHLFFPTLFNVIEHLGYAANGLLLLAWCWFGIKKSEADDYD